MPHKGSACKRTRRAFVLRPRAVKSYRESLQRVLNQPDYLRIADRPTMQIGMLSRTDICRERRGSSGRTLAQTPSQSLETISVNHKQEAREEQK
jgi:hypothetical protein